MSPNVLRIKEVANGNLGKSLISFLSAVIRPFRNLLNLPYNRDLPYISCDRDDQQADIDHRNLCLLFQMDL
jgi:hypothetical protein